LAAIVAEAKTEAPSRIGPTSLIDEAVANRRIS
jgi:hypothetical protein